MDFTSLKVIVTGASRGIGKALTEALLHHGAIVGCGSRNPLASSGRANELPLKIDVRDASQVKAAIGSFVETTGSLDGMILCAAIGKTGLFVRQSPELEEEMIATNIHGVLNCIRYALPHFVRSGRPAFVINLSSVAVEKPTAGMAIYSATKAAIEMIGNSLAVEYASRGVHFINLRLGPTDTDMWRECHLANSPQLKERLPNGPMKPATVAGFIVKLIESPHAHLSGSTIRFDCGFHMT